MDKGTFGSIKQYKMLEVLNEKILLMDEKKKNHISSIIQDINKKIKNSEQINDISFKNYILDLIYYSFKQRIEIYIKNKYEDKITTYLQNYLKAKIKNAREK